MIVILTSSVQFSCSFLPRERLRNDGKLVFRDKKALDNKSLIALLSVVPLYTLLVICILTRTSGSRRYCKTRKNVQQYCTLKRLIRYVYIYLSAHIIYSEKWTGFQERSLRKALPDLRETDKFQKQIPVHIFKDKRSYKRAHILGIFGCITRHV